MKKSIDFKTKKDILDLLKQKGPQDALRLAREVNCTSMAIRQHLYELQKKMYVSYFEEHRSSGRPAKVWQLTKKAEKYFPDKHAELTVQLLDNLKESLGNDGLNKLLSVREKSLIKYYKTKIPSKVTSLLSKLKILARLRTSEGYMAEIKEDSDGNYLLIENHCPICTAAENCQGLCQVELNVFQSVLGKKTKVERNDHIIKGSRRCIYRIKSE